jgi:hypothetical protein
MIGRGIVSIILAIIGKKIIILPLGSKEVGNS